MARQGNPKNEAERLVIGLSGASGVAYGIRLLEACTELGIESHLVMTKPAEMTIGYETKLSPRQVAAKADYSYAVTDIAAPIASGSFKTKGMILAPCSVRSMSEIATGVTTSLLTRANPKEKVGLSALWTLDVWSINLRETFYGPTSAYYSPDGGTYYLNEVKTTAITDLEIDYHYLESWTIAFGANNLTDKNPESRLAVNATTLSDGSNVVGAPLGISPYGINGGFYYTRLTFNF